MTAFPASLKSLAPTPMVPQLLGILIKPMRGQEFMKPIAINLQMHKLALGWHWHKLALKWARAGTSWHWHWALGSNDAAYAYYMGSKSVIPYVLR